jgi:hypothetical protein
LDFIGAVLYRLSGQIICDAQHTKFCAIDDEQWGLTLSGAETARL